MGSHTDYNLGRVLTLPISLDTWIAARPRPDGLVRVCSLNLEEEVTFRLDHLVPDPNTRWSNYIRGVAQVLAAEGLNVVGFDAVLHSTVPMSSGLSSSAALECATATLFESLAGAHLEPDRKARLCQKAENDFVGVQCGILDQFTSCLGRADCALLLDCRDLSTSAVRIAPDIDVVVCDTRSRRELASSEYARRRAECEEGARRLGARVLREIRLEEFYRRESELPEPVARRCRFILEEDARVPALAEALITGNQRQIGRLCAASFEGAMTLYEIGVPAMQRMMDCMREAPGVIGARQAGAGFGGCMVAFVEHHSVEAFTASIRQTYRGPENQAAQVYCVEPAPGAGPLEPSVWQESSDEPNQPILNPHC
jgi:galactokinase